MDSKQEMFKESARKMPDTSGVYMFKDEKDRVLYVGKAKNLKKRVSSYFKNEPADRIERLVNFSVSLEYITTRTELEALLLECNLIKRHVPKFNVVLKDDKSYPYLAFIGKKFPRVCVTRKTGLKDAKYFGPYTAKSLRNIMETLRSIFPYATCRDPEKGVNGRECLYCHIKKCAGPCINAVTEEDYKKMLKNIEMFLEGKQKIIEQSLQKEMLNESVLQNFERAAIIRDRLLSLKSISQKQTVMSGQNYSADFIGHASKGGKWLFKVFMVRDGKLTDVKEFFVPGFSDENEALRLFVLQYYAVTSLLPSVIYVSLAIKDRDLISDWLTKRASKKVMIKTPARGEKKSLLDMAIMNAKENLVDNIAKRDEIERKNKSALMDLKNDLTLSRYPKRIECYDISNISGTHVTGSIVTFIDGAPRKDHYRMYKIKTAESGDVHMMRELLNRRFHNNGLADDPDLVVIDGGIAQLNVAKSVLDEAKKSNIDCISLAKKEETVYSAHGNIPVRIADGSASKLLLMKMRDEAHRFAVSYHRKLRQKNGLNSFLDEINGLGPKRRKLIMTKFTSPGEIKEKGVSGLEKIGIPNKVAANVISHFENGENTC